MTMEPWEYDACRFERENVDPRTAELIARINRVGESATRAFASLNDSMQKAVVAYNALSEAMQKARPEPPSVKPDTNQQ